MQQVILALCTLKFWFQVVQHEKNFLFTIMTFVAVVNAIFLTNKVDKVSHTV